MDPDEEARLDQESIDRAIEKTIEATDQAWEGQ